MADTDWRRELWLAHAGARFRHRSDGDMHCPVCEIDFARDSPQQIGHQLAKVARDNAWEWANREIRSVHEWLDHVDRILLEEDPPGPDVDAFQRILRLGQRVRRRQRITFSTPTRGGYLFQDDEAAESRGSDAYVIS